MGVPNICTVHAYTQVYTQACIDLHKHVLHRCLHTYQHTCPAHHEPAHKPTHISCTQANAHFLHANLHTCPTHKPTHMPYTHALHACQHTCHKEVPWSSTYIQSAVDKLCHPARAAPSLSPCSQSGVSVDQGHNYMGQNCIDHIYTGHDCIGHNYMTISTQVMTA